MKLKKYRVIKKTPKPIMNAGRMVNLEHDKTVYLKDERQVRVLQEQGYIREIEEYKKEEPKQEMKKEEESKPEPEVQEEKEEDSEPKEYYHQPKKKKGRKGKKKQEQSSAKEAEDQMEQE